MPHDPMTHKRNFMKGNLDLTDLSIHAANPNDCPLGNKSAVAEGLQQNSGTAVILAS